MIFASFVRAAGLIAGDVYPDGKWRRCPTESHPRKRNGSYKLALDGLIGWCQDFAVHSEPLTWRPDGDVHAFDAAAFAKRKAVERNALNKARYDAWRFYFTCNVLRGGHPYLESHGLSMAGCYGLRIDSKGWLVIPLYRDRDLISVQRISPEGDKKFWPGASVKGGEYALERNDASINVLCEGFATGAAIFAAAPLTRVVVAFNAGNLANIRLGPGLAVVAADNDHETQGRLGHNPGLKAAQEAAERLGCWIAVPSGIDGTDWADWRLEMIARRIADKPKRARESEIRRGVDAEIAAAMMRNARFMV